MVRPTLNFFGPATVKKTFSLKPVIRAISEPLKTVWTFFLRNSAPFASQGIEVGQIFAILGRNTVPYNLRVPLWAQSRVCGGPNLSKSLFLGQGVLETTRRGRGEFLKFRDFDTLLPVKFCQNLNFTLLYSDFEI